MRSVTKKKRNKGDWRAWWLRTQYGITHEQYNILLESQNGRCAICRSLPEKDRKLAVDHEHTTSRVRGLLCSKCNRGLGLFQDSPELLKEAARYAVDR